MNTLVLNELRFRSEQLLTLGTVIEFFTRVNSLVLCKKGLFVEDFLTLRAREGLTGYEASGV